jgi:hypothetical protein
VIERPPIDYAALEAAMTVAEDTIRRARHNLNALHAAPPDRDEGAEENA